MPREGRPIKYGPHMITALENLAPYSAIEARELLLPLVNATARETGIDETSRKAALASMYKISGKFGMNFDTQKRVGGYMRSAWFGWRWKAGIAEKFYVNPADYAEVQALNAAWERGQWVKAQQDQGQQDQEPREEKPILDEVGIGSPASRPGRRCFARFAVAALLLLAVQWPRVPQNGAIDVDEYLQGSHSATGAHFPTPLDERVPRNWKKTEPQDKMLPSPHMYIATAH